MLIQIPHSKETEGLGKGQEVCIRVNGLLIGYGRIVEVSAGGGLKVQLSKEAEENIPNLYRTKEEILKDRQEEWLDKVYHHKGDMRPRAEDMRPPTSQETFVRAIMDMDYIDNIERDRREKDMKNNVTFTG